MTSHPIFSSCKHLQIAQYCITRSKARLLSEMPSKKAALLPVRNLLPVSSLPLLFWSPLLVSLPRPHFQEELFQPNAQICLLECLVLRYTRVRTNSPRKTYFIEGRLSLFHCSIEIDGSLSCLKIGLTQGDSKRGESKSSQYGDMLLNTCIAPHIELVPSTQLLMESK